MMQDFRAWGPVTNDGVWFSLATIILACICAATHLLVRHWIRRKRGILRQEELHRDLKIMPQLSTRIPPAHVHVIDHDRMLLQVTDTNSIYTRCCVVGCEEPIFIAHASLEYLKLRIPQIVEARVGAALIAKREASFFDTLPNRRNVKL